jgi:CRP-like cAMP-binding protein
MPARALDHRTQLDILLARSDLFGLLDPEELRGLAQNARRCRAAAGTPVVRQGEAGDSLFVVVEGVLEVEVTTEDGRRHRMRLLAPGDMFGEYSLLTGAPRSATVAARTDSLLFEITKGDLVPVLERCPELAAAMSRILAARQTSRGQLTAGDADLAADLAPHVEPGLLGRICAFFGLPH